MKVERVEDGSGLKTEEPKVEGLKADWTLVNPHVCESKICTGLAQSKRGRTQTGHLLEQMRYLYQPICAERFSEGSDKMGRVHRSETETTYGVLVQDVRNMRGCEDFLAKMQVFHRFFWAFITDLWPSSELQ